jgi:MtN3 and saliva related transmembrane protein
MALSLQAIRSTDALGYVAAILTTVAFLPQAWLTWRKRAVEGVSTAMYSMFSVGVALWGIYGIVIHSWPVVIANALTLVQSLLILSVKLLGQTRDRPLLMTWRSARSTRDSSCARVAH